MAHALRRRYDRSIMQLLKEFERQKQDAGGDDMRYSDISARFFTEKIATGEFKVKARDVPAMLEHLEHYKSQIDDILQNPILMAKKSVIDTHMIINDFHIAKKAIQVLKKEEPKLPFADKELLQLRIASSRATRTLNPRNVENVNKITKINEDIAELMRIRLEAMHEIEEQAFGRHADWGELADIYDE